MARWCGITLASGWQVRPVGGKKRTARKWLEAAEGMQWPHIILHTRKGRGMLRFHSRRNPALMGEGEGERSGAGDCAHV
jgi:hypothetical protein